MFDYNIDYQNQSFLPTYNKIITLLRKLKNLDSEAYERIHKGVPFYFGAISAFLIHNYQSAVYLFDAAVSEDIKNDFGQRTPAILFMVLEGNNPAQAGRNLTEIAENKLENFANLYNQASGARAISLDEIKTRFFERAVGDRLDWRTHATAWISFLLEWNYLYILQEIRGQEGTWEPFYVHLFKGCLLFESLIKSNPSVAIPEGQLGQILASNAEVRNRFGIMGNVITGGFTFPDLLANLPSANSTIQTDLEFVARLRNTVGHNLGWNVQILPNQYIKMVSKIANVCLHTISNLY